jgi:hypothetical protein
MGTRRPTWLSLSGSPCSHTWSAMLSHIARGCFNLTPLSRLSQHSQQTIHYHLHILHKVHLPYYLYPVISVTPKLQITLLLVVCDLSITQTTGSSVALATWRRTTGGISNKPYPKDPLLLIKRFVLLSFQPITPLRKQPQTQQNSFIKKLPCVQFELLLVQQVVFRCQQKCCQWPRPNNQPGSQPSLPI